MTDKERIKAQRGQPLSRSERAEALARLATLEARLECLMGRIARGEATPEERTTARALEWRIEAQRERIFAPQRKNAYDVGISIKQ